MRAGGDEVWGYVSESEDTGGDRLYVNEETCLEYLKRHLQHSSLYRCSEVEALDHMATCELKAEIETEETRVQIREEYKAHTEQEAKKKRAREAEEKEKETIAKKRYAETREAEEKKVRRKGCFILEAGEGEAAGEGEVCRG